MTREKYEAVCKPRHPDIIKKSAEHIMVRNCMRNNEANEALATRTFDFAESRKHVKLRISGIVSDA